MNIYRKAGLWAVVSTYFLIFIGGLVRVSGAGLGCPDWPKCFGRWFPPFNASQLPPEFDAASFNFTLAWIEYINRLVGVFVGFAILLVAILAIIYFRKNASVLIPSLLAALLVAYQGWQGSQVVASELDPIIVSLHMILAFVIISLLVFASLEAHFISSGNRKMGVFPASIPRLLLAGWIFGIVVVLLGTQVRQQAEIAMHQYPLLFKTELIAKLGITDDLHMTVAIFTAIIAISSAWLILSKAKDVALLIKQAAWALICIVVLQISFGYSLTMLGLSEIVQLLHLWMASLLMGILLMLYVSVQKGGKVSHV